MELTVKSPIEDTTAVTESISTLLCQNNSLQFTDITLLTSFTTRGEPPTYRLYFYIDLAKNIEYLKIRSQIPITAILATASIQVANCLAPLNCGTRFLNFDDLADIAAELIPTSEKATYIIADTSTWTFYTSSSSNIWQIVEKLTYPVMVAQRFHYHNHRVVWQTLIAACDARGSVTPRTRLKKGAIYRIRFQQYPILTWFIPTPRPFTVRGVVSVK